MTDRKIRRKAIARHGSKIFGSRIARLIFASNLAGLAILIIGAMVLNEMRAGFVVSKKQDLVAQAQIFTSLLGDDATTPAPMLDDEAARQTIVRLNLPERVRARIYSPDGELVGDSFYLSERVDIDALPPLQEPSSFARKNSRSPCAVRKRPVSAFQTGASGSFPFPCRSSVCLLSWVS